MKVTAFIRKTAAKNNITDQARVYFRVRDIGGVDIKAASELSINPNHWSPERQGYKPRVALVSEEKKMAFDKDVQQITHLITKEYHRGVDGNWLKGLIEEYHHPNINARAATRPTSTCSRTRYGNTSTRPRLRTKAASTTSTISTRCCATSVSGTRCCTREASACA